MSSSPLLWIICRSRRCYHGFWTFLQKIKSVVFHAFKRHGNCEKTIIEPLAPKRLGPSVKPVDADSFPRVLEFALNAANLKPGDSGIGILLPNEWGNYSAAVDHACKNFRYAAIYSDNGQASDAAAERILARFGLPIMTYKAAEFSKCRYPLLMDFTAGKLRLGRDLCIIGTDENGLPVRG